MLFAKITPCMENGKAAIARGLVNGIGFGSTEFHVLRPGPDILPERVFAFLRQPAFRAVAKANFTGTAGQQRVPTDFISSALIPVAPLSEQERLVRLLDEAETLRRLRARADERMADFIPALFHEMFGDYFGRKYPCANLGDLVTITGGGTPARDIDEYYTGSIPWLTSKDMRGIYIYDTEEHITEDAIKNSATKLVPANSILVVVKSKILMRRLPVAIAGVPLCHGQDIKSIQCSEKVLPVFIMYTLKYYERRLLSLARGANTEGLTLPMLRELTVPDVPFSLQKEFADRAAEVRTMEEKQAQSKARLGALFDSMLARAFAGEL